MVWKRESLLLSITIPIDIAICTDGKCFLVGVLRRSASVRCHYLFMLVGVYRSRPVQNDVGGSGDCRCYRRNSDTTKTIRYGFVGFFRLFRSQITHFLCLFKTAPLVFSVATFLTRGLRYERTRKAGNKTMQCRRYPQIFVDPPVIRCL